MKKTSIALIIAILFFTKANCQLDKGNWLVGGNGTYSSDKTKVPGTTYINKSVRLEIRPNIGYFITDKFAAGLDLGYVFEKSKQLYFATKGHSYNLGPFIRYYFLPKERLINVFTQASYYYGRLKTTNLQVGGNSSSYSNTQGYSFLAGPVVYFNSTVGLELNIGYYHRDGEGVGLNNSVRVGIGFQIHLEKK